MTQKHDDENQPVIDKTKLTKLALAVRIREVVYPVLCDRQLFTFQPRGPHSIWISESFHIASVMTPFFTSFEVWPIRNGSGLAEHPDGEGKVMNLARSPFGEYELVSFRRGDWERDLLRYVGAPLGLLTVRALKSSIGERVG